MDNIKLRPHHLLCQEFFVGHGYSDEFVENMGNIIRTMRENNSLIEIVCDNDDVCKCCPNLIGGKCKDIDKVNVYDANVKKFADFNEGVYRYNDLKDAVVKGIVNAQIELKDVCKDCCWIDICEQIRGRK